jgi:UDP-hydrolysing UDP-N-acetyl-D-glucosamine 2-epimerase
MGQHLLYKYGESVEEIERDGFEIAERIHMLVEGEVPVTMAKSTGLAIIELASIYQRLSPDMVVVTGDRFEALAVAVAAALMNIPLVHIQGGEVTGSVDESIRHSITKLAHFHFAATEASRERIVRMGEPSENVATVGCPSADLLLSADPGPRSQVFDDPTLKPKDGRPLRPEDSYLLLLQHPVTTEFGHGHEQIKEVLCAIKEIGMQTLMFWPNADAGSEEIVIGIRRFLLKENARNIYMYRHVDSETFVKLMYHAACIVGNSSAGIREACYFGVPVVNVGTRQNGRERGSNVIDVSCDRHAIAEGIRMQLSNGRYPPECVYGDGHAGQRIADILSRVDISRVQKKIAY